ncbi:MAG: lysostaphin resistance A-like protein [Acetanaerobacterium sp.]
MTQYIKKLIFPILWELVFIASYFLIAEEHFIYTNFIFYFGIIVYFVKTGDFKLQDLKQNIKGGKVFWFPVLWTAVAMIIAFLFSAFLGGLFPNVDDGMFGLAQKNWLQLILFAISTIVFPPLAEELFFRKAIIRFDSKFLLIITSLLGMVLYTLEHSLSWLGIFQTMIIAIPLTVSYIKTKNVYIPMAAHFIVNVIGNGPSVVFTAIKFISG